jgi:anti-sigma B factor antagonist
LESLIADGAGDVRVDMMGVTFIDSTALALLVQMHTLLRSSGARLKIVDPSPVVVRLLHLAGLVTVLDVETT